MAKNSSFFWHKLNGSQKATLVLAAFAILLLPVAMAASQKETRTIPKAASDVVPSPIKSADAEKTAMINTVSETIGKDVNTNPGKLQPPEKLAAIVGAEKIYNNDLNFILSRDYPQEYATASPNLNKLKDLALPIAIEESLLLQSGKNTIISLTADIFNNVNKNYELRRARIKELRTYLEKGEEKISGEIITVWYHNVELPPIVRNEGKTLLDAQNIAWEKIVQTYKDIKAGKNFREAGAALEQDTVLGSIDPSYKANAYFEFSGKSRSDTLFVRPDLNDFAWKLQPGQISSIIQIPPMQIPLGKYDEEFFAIIKVTKRENAGAGDLEKLLINEKKNRVIKNCDIETCQ